LQFSYAKTNRLIVIRLPDFTLHGVLGTDPTSWVAHQSRRDAHATEVTLTQDDNPHERACAYSQGDSQTLLEELKTLLET
jgi:hypothetical protein